MAPARPLVCRGPLERHLLIICPLTSPKLSFALMGTAKRLLVAGIVAIYMSCSSFLVLGSYLEAPYEPNVYIRFVALTGCPRNKVCFDHPVVEPRGPVLYAELLAPGHLWGPFDGGEVFEWKHELPLSNYIVRAGGPPAGTGAYTAFQSILTVCHINDHGGITGCQTAEGVGEKSIPILVGPSWVSLSNVIWLLPAAVGFGLFLASALASMRRTKSESM